MFPRVSQKVASLLVVLAVAVSPCLVWSAGNNGTITGAVKKASGEPAAGAFVKVTNTERKLVFLVISQDQGKFRAANLPPGKYQVQGIGGGMQSDLSPMTELAAGQQATVNLTLNGPQPEKPKPLPASEYPKMMTDGKGKDLVMAQCATCHDVNRIVAARYNREGWEDTVGAMLGFIGGPAAAGLKEEQVKEMVDYLAERFGENVPSPNEVPESAWNSHFPKTWMQGAAAKYVVVEQDLPKGSDSHDVSVDSKGIGWVSERRFGMIGRFDPQTLTYTKIPLPPAAYKKFTLNALAVDPQDRVWAVDGGPNKRLLQYDPKTREFNSFTVPDPPLGTTVFNTIRFAQDGSIWATEITANQILRLDPATRKFTAYQVPAGAGKKASAFPYGMGIDGNQNIWFVENRFPKVGKVDVLTGTVTEFDVPVKKNDLRRMDADAEGNLWFGVCGDGKLGKVDFRTGQITLLDPPTPNACPYSISVDRKHNLIWFGELDGDRIGRFDPRTNTFVEFPLPRAKSDVRRIEVDRSRPNRVYFSGAAAALVGYIEVLE
ncbi:MAG: hypothetical protein A3J28_10480 [Acidobacteria bacterium RIFCSPLOWO2_12_FULL_60_22]|nr:MAG: hypothetical protein A3J28_10480 [Acidobacteria bacterium RIFCSPLOWO2_12_FULL_60_22]